MFGLRHPNMASALVVAGVGAGSPPDQREEFRAQSRALAERFRTEGAAVVAMDYGVGPTRVQLQNKDPRSWAEFARHFAEHSAEGSAFTMKNVQAGRPSLYDFAGELGRLTIPVLLVVGDEDEPCLDASLFLKRAMPSAALWMFPRTGHMINLEESAMFNRVVQDFFGTVERGRWSLRDPRATVRR
jgi:pimeloyl-ACP methyl ester carboxylesterase